MTKPANPFRYFGRHANHRVENSHLPFPLTGLELARATANGWSWEL